VRRSMIAYPHFNLFLHTYEELGKIKVAIGFPGDNVCDRLTLENTGVVRN
jgi:hypothetical protein